MDGASFPQEGPEPEPYQPGHDEQRDKQKRLPLVGVRWHRIHCKELERLEPPKEPRPAEKPLGVRVNYRLFCSAKPRR